MREDMKRHLQNPTSWKRLLYMLLFAVLYNVAEMVLVVVVILQFLITLFTGSSNMQLLSFGKQLSKYVYAVMIFLTYNSEQLPFPFSEWPKGFSEQELAEKRSRQNYQNDH